MSHISPTVDEFADLPPRTWRGWWREQPRWFHIGVWAVRVLVLLHVAVALRIAWGWQESSGVAELRGRMITVRYFWEERTRRFPYEELIWAGWYGRDWRNISRIQWSDLGTESQLVEIGRRCRRLNWLQLSNARVSPQVIGGLGNCRSLETLDLQSTRTDDAAISRFGRLRRLKSLNLMDTLVSDQSIAVLKALPNLRRVELSFTDVSLAAIQSWRDSCELPPVINSDRLHFPNAIVASLRWSDGERSVNFPRPFEIRVAGPAPSPRQRQFQSRRLFSRRSVWWHNLLAPVSGDGDYDLTIQFDSCQSHPFAISIRDRKPSMTSIEFQMPCTKAEALRLPAK